MRRQRKQPTHPRRMRVVETVKVDPKDLESERIEQQPDEQGKRSSPPAEPVASTEPTESEQP